MGYSLEICEIFLKSVVSEVSDKYFKGFSETYALEKRKGRGERRSYFSIMIFSLPKGRGAGIVFFLDLAISVSWIL